MSNPYACENTTNYEHPRDPNLNDIHNAMDYNDAGEPLIRTHVDGITLQGDVIVDKVKLWDGTNNLTFEQVTNDGESGQASIPSESYNMIFNGTNWDRMRGTINDGVLVELSNSSIAVTGTVALDTATLTALETITVNQGTAGATSWKVNIGTDGTVTLAAGTASIGTVGLNAGTNTIGKVDQASTSNPWVISKNSTINSADNPLNVTFTNSTIGVTGSFWQETQPVSGTVTIQDGGNTITVDGTVNANVTFPETQTVDGTVTADVTFPSIYKVSKDTNDNSTSNRIFVDVGTPTVNATFTGTVTTTVVDGQQDAFGRLRVSEAFTLGDYKHTYGIDPNFRDTLINGGTVTHIANQACARLATTSNTTSSVIHQTKMYHNYMPGKSQLIKTTINFYSATTNVTKRTGYFDDLNGIYFEQNGSGVLSFVIRTNTSGSPSDTRRVTQAQWNHDTCNTTISGTSTDGSNFGLVGSWDLDITKTQIVFIDFQWLGVGRVRCGFVHNGLMIIAHEFYNDNSLPVVYMANPNLPIRCEILNTGTTTGGYFDQICSTVVSEGGYMESGIDFSVDTGQTSQSITVADGMYPIIAIRLKNSFRSYPNRVVVRSGNINVYAEEFPAYWALYKLDNLSEITLSSPTWTSVNNDSAVEYTLLATAFTGGDRLDGGIVGTTSPGGSAKGTGTAPVNQPSNAKKNFISQNQDSSDSEIYVVCGKAIGGTTKMWVDFQWREIY